MATANANTAADNEALTQGQLDALEAENNGELPLAQVTYTNYQPGQYICFTRNETLPWVYGIISGPSSDIADGGKRYPFIYYDDTQINTNSSLTDTARREAQQPRTVITSLDEKIINNTIYYYLKYNPTQLDYPPSMIYFVRDATSYLTDTNIRNILFAAYTNNRSAFTRIVGNSIPSRDSSIASRDSSIASSRDSSNYSPAVSRSTSSSRGSSVGGKKYRKKKNKTRRRNKKTKRRNNRKSKRR
jgi:hypothetical protein